MELTMSFDLLADNDSELVQGGSHEAWDPGKEGKGAIFAICQNASLSSGTYAIVTPSGRVIVKDPTQFANGGVPASNNGQGTFVSSGLGTNLC